MGPTTVADTGKERPGSIDVACPLTPSCSTSPGSTATTTDVPENRVGSLGYRNLPPRHRPRPASDRPGRPVALRGGQLDHLSRVTAHRASWTNTKRRIITTGTTKTISTSEEPRSSGAILNSD